MGLMRFPEYFPKQCPPADSSEASGTFYRTIKGSVPVKKDFLPHWLLKTHNQQEWIKQGKACQACGLSVNTNIENLKRKMDILPTLRNKNIVEGTLAPNMGKVKPSPSLKDPDHHTWWIPTTVKDPSVLFKVVA